MMRNAFNRRSGKREDIKRSRVETVRDRHFSTTNNAELIAFAREQDSEERVLKM